MFPGDAVKYKHTKSKHGSQRASIALVEDSQSTQRTTLDNNTVLLGELQDIRRVKLFATEARCHMRNMVADWHNMKEFMLKAGVF